MLDAVAQHGPTVVVGLGQGGLIAALASMPLLIEQACRYRVVGMEEMARYRISWAKVLALIAINPEVMPQKSDIEHVKQAVPEILRTQPRGVYLSLIHI